MYVIAQHKTYRYIKECRIVYIPLFCFHGIHQTAPDDDGDDDDDDVDDDSKIKNIMRRRC